MFATLPDPAYCSENLITENSGRCLTGGLIVITSAELVVQYSASGTMQAGVCSLCPTPHTT